MGLQKRPISFPFPLPRSVRLKYNKYDPLEPPCHLFHSPNLLVLLQRVKWSGLLLMVGIVTTLGIAVPVGYNIGVINSTGELITAWLKTTLMDRNDTVPTDVGLDLIWSTVVAIFLVGGAIGSLGGAWVADRFGR